MLRMILVNGSRERGGHYLDFAQNFDFGSELVKALGKIFVAAVD